MCTSRPVSATRMPSTFLPTSQDKTEVLSLPSLMVEPEGAGVKVEGEGGGGERERGRDRQR